MLLRLMAQLGGYGMANVDELLHCFTAYSVVLISKVIVLSSLMI